MSVTYAGELPPTSRQGPLLAFESYRDGGGVGKCRIPRRGRRRSRGRAHDRGNMAIEGGVGRPRGPDATTRVLEGREFARRAAVGAAVRVEADQTDEGAESTRKRIRRRPWFLVLGYDPARPCRSTARSQEKNEGMRGAQYMAWSPEGNTEHRRDTASRVCPRALRICAPRGVSKAQGQEDCGRWRAGSLRVKKQARRRGGEISPMQARLAQRGCSMCIGRTLHTQWGAVRLDQQPQLRGTAGRAQDAPCQSRMAAAGVMAGSLASELGYIWRWDRWRLSACLGDGASQATDVERTDRPADASSASSQGFGQFRSPAGARTRTSNAQEGAPGRSILRRELRLGFQREHAVWAIKDHGFDAVIAPFDESKTLTRTALATTPRDGRGPSRAVRESETVSRSNRRAHRHSPQRPRNLRDGRLHPPAHHAGPRRHKPHPHPRRGPRSLRKLPTSPSTKRQVARTIMMCRSTRGDY